MRRHYGKMGKSLKNSVSPDQVYARPAARPLPARDPLLVLMHATISDVRRYFDDLRFNVVISVTLDGKPRGTITM